MEMFSQMLETKWKWWRRRISREMHETWRSCEKFFLFSFFYLFFFLSVAQFKYISLCLCKCLLLRFDFVIHDPNHEPWKRETTSLLSSFAAILIIPSSELLFFLSTSTFSPSPLKGRIICSRWCCYCLTCTSLWISFLPFQIFPLSLSFWHREEERKKVEGEEEETLMKRMNNWKLLLS